VVLHDFANERQPDARSARRSAESGLKQTRQIIFCDSAAGVFDPHYWGRRTLGVLQTVCQSCVDNDLTSTRYRLLSVGQQVIENFQHLIAIGPHHWKNTLS
jgi:hypothetical protein